MGAGVDSDVGIGSTGFTSSSWVAGADLFLFLERPMYALSDVLVVVPEPSTALLLMTGLLGLASYRRGRVRG